MGGVRAKRPKENPRSSVRPREAREARRSDVNDSRSEPGNTRLSKDDGSIASKLPQIIDIDALTVVIAIAMIVSYDI